MSLEFPHVPSVVVPCPVCTRGRVGCRLCDCCHGQGWLELPAPPPEPRPPVAAPTVAR